MIHRPLTMTIVCASCSNQYGLWRPQCPACGTSTPRPEPLNTPRVVEPRAQPRRDPVWHECTFCHMRGAKKHRCETCNEPVHGTCRAMHNKVCQEFQSQVAEIEATL